MISGNSTQKKYNILFINIFNFFLPNMDLVFSKGVILMLLNCILKIACHLTLERFLMHIFFLAAIYCNTLIPKGVMSYFLQAHLHSLEVYHLKQLGWEYIWQLVLMKFYCKQNIY